MPEALQKNVIARDEAMKLRMDLCGCASVQKGVNLAERTVDGIASTINVDRDGEIILPSAFAGDAERFINSNAPFLAAHAHRSQDGSPTQIGCVKTMKISKVDVRCTFQFGVTTLAEEWWKLASDPKLKGIAFSIGFIPLEYVTGTVGALLAQFPEIRGAVKLEGLKPEDTIRVYTRIEVLEISGCPAPSNRPSLQLLAAKLFGEPNDKALDELLTKCNAVDGKLDAFAKQYPVLLDRISELMERIELGPMPSDPFGPTSQAAPPASDKGHEGDGTGKTSGAASKALGTELTRMVDTACTD